MRLSVLKEVAGLDILRRHPPSADATPAAGNWTYDTMLKAAEACNRARMAFGIGLGTTPDPVDTAAALFAVLGTEVITAKGLIAYLSQREKVEARRAVALGYDVPPFASMTDFRIWDEVAPCTTTPSQVAPSRELDRGRACSARCRRSGLRPWHGATMLARLQSGQSIQVVRDWAEDEPEGFVR